MYDRKITDLDAWMRRIHGYIAYVYRPDVYKCINPRNGIEIKSEIIPWTEMAIKPISKRLKPKGDSLYSNLHMLANAIDFDGMVESTNLVQNESIPTVHFGDRSRDKVTSKK
jgi:hypothetical protein